MAAVAPDWAQLGQGAPLIRLKRAKDYEDAVKWSTTPGRPEYIGAQIFGGIENFIRAVENYNTQYAQYTADFYQDIADSAAASESATDKYKTNSAIRAEEKKQDVLDLLDKQKTINEEVADLFSPAVSTTTSPVTQPVAQPTGLDQNVADGITPLPMIPGTGTLEESKTPEQVAFEEEVPEGFVKSWNEENQDWEVVPGVPTEILKASRAVKPTVVFEPEINRGAAPAVGLPAALPGPRTLVPMNPARPTLSFANQTIGRSVPASRGDPAALTYGLTADQAAAIVGKKEGGSIKATAKGLAALGRNGDTMLAHITPQEAAMLKAMGGAGTINPQTGLPEFFLDDIFDFAGDVIGGVGDFVGDVWDGVVKPVGDFIGDAVDVVWENLVENPLNAIKNEPLLGTAVALAGAPFLAPTLGLTTATTAGLGSLALNTAASGDLETGIQQGLLAWGAGTGLEALGAPGYAATTTTTAGATGAGTGALGTTAPSAGYAPVNASGAVAAPGSYGSVGVASTPTAASIAVPETLNAPFFAGDPTVAAPGAFEFAMPAGAESAFAYGPEGEFLGAMTGDPGISMATQRTVAQPVYGSMPGTAAPSTGFFAKAGEYIPQGVKDFGATVGEYVPDFVKDMDATDALFATYLGSSLIAGEQERRAYEKQYQAYLDEQNRKRRLGQAGFERTLAQVPVYGAMSAKSGGLMSLAKGGITYAEGGGATGPANEPRMIKGSGDGMSDSVPATIEGVQEARLANDEFVIPADVVADLGNGSSSAGAKQLYAMMDRVREARHGTTEQPPEINAMKLMPA